MGVESESKLDQVREEKGRERIGWKLWKNKPPTRYFPVLPLPIPNPENIRTDLADIIDRWGRRRPRTEKHVMTRRIRGKEFLRWATGLLITGGTIGGGYALRRWGAREIKEAKFSDDIEKAEVSWCYLLRGGDVAGNEVRKVIGSLVGLPRDRNLKDYDSWAYDTQFGFYVRGLHGFVEDLMTEEGRNELKDLVDQYETQIDLSEAIGDIGKVETYIQEEHKEKTLSVEELGAYFQSKEHLGYEPRQWEAIKKVYEAVEKKDGRILEEMLSQNPEELAAVLGVREEEVRQVIEQIEMADTVLQETGVAEVVDLEATVTIAQTLPPDYTVAELQTAVGEILMPAYIPQSSGLERVDIPLVFAMTIGLLTNQAPRVKEWAMGELKKILPKKKS